MFRNFLKFGSTEVTAMNLSQRVALLAVLIESLPQDFRFSLFDQFRNEIGDFLNSLAINQRKFGWKKNCLSQKRFCKRAGPFVATKLPFCAMAVKGTEGVNTFTVSFGFKVPLKVSWKFSASNSKATMKFIWQFKGDALSLPAPVKAVRKLPVEVRCCLWALLDDLLADYKAICLQQNLIC